MDCKFDKEIIHKYIDNTIDPLELIFLKEHIKVCEDCRNELELMNKLDGSLYGYFDEMQPHEMLEDFSLSVLNKCYEEKKATFRQKVEKAVEINNAIIGNTTRFASYLPGSKAAKKTAHMVGRGIGKALRSCLSYGVKKVVSSTAK